MTAHNIVVGQKIDPVKAQRAREHRHQMTGAEQALWQQLRAGRLHGLHFRRQQVIDGFIVDFYCHAAGVVVEVDGAVHEGQTGYDEERDQVLQARGLQVLRVSNAEASRDISGVLDRIAVACGAREG